ncbi:MAG: FAD-dependent oxidoreductase [Pseudomonadota bacterium]
MRIAIVGSGVSGLGAAWALAPSHDVTLFERADRLGGHTNTVDIEYDGAPIAVDTGFIVYNEPNYPNLKALFAHLGVATEDSDMSFAMSRPSGVEWGSDNANTIFAQRRNLVSPKFLYMLTEILRFNKQTSQDLERGEIGDLSLGRYLEKWRFGSGFRDDYLLPMGAAIWSTPADDMLDFPALSFLRFFENHKLNAISKHDWRTVTGGARNYIPKLIAGLEGRVRLGEGVQSVRRAGQVEVVTDKGAHEMFDHIIFACHSDQALAALADPTPLEAKALGDIKYGPNRAILHRDPSLMPRSRRAWASWNYLCDGPQTRAANDEAEGVSLTYYMNRLQNIPRETPLFVTLNPRREPRPELVFAEFDYDHPQFDGGALQAQKALPYLQGINRTWFAGAYSSYGFHEDGLSSGLRVAVALGADLPWTLDESRLPQTEDAPPAAYQALIEPARSVAAQ